MFDRFDDRTLEIATVIVVVVIALVILCYLAIYINPWVIFNPFPPDTPTPVAVVTDIVGPTWTPSPTPTDTATPGPTNTWTPSPMPTDTPTPTPTATTTTHDRCHPQTHRCHPQPPRNPLGGQADQNACTSTLLLRVRRGASQLRADPGVGVRGWGQRTGRAERADAGGQRSGMARGHLDRCKWFLCLRVLGRAKSWQVVRPRIQGRGSPFGAILVGDQRWLRWPV